MLADNHSNFSVRKNNKESEKISQQLTNIISIGIALSAEKDHNKLIEMIITEAMRITNSDAGTLYLLDDNSLKMKIIHNRSMKIFKGGKGEEIDLPAVPLNPAYVSSYVALEGKAVSVEDVYRVENFDFSGARKYDKMTGYRTTSMLVLPLKDYLNEVIGVLQLINAMDENNEKTISFNPDDQNIVEALASLAATSLTNMNLIKEVEDLFESFAQVIVTAIDEQTPYNATHTRKVSKLSCIIAEKINELQEGTFADEFFNEERLKALAMAGWLHDVGKIATPLDVMNKSSRLDTKLPLVLQRLEYALEKEKRSSLEKQLEYQKNHETKKNQDETAALEMIIALYTNARETILTADNPATFIDDELKKKIMALRAITYYDYSGNKCYLIDEKEEEALLIERGTLTERERRIIEEHVVITEKMLSKVPFSRKLVNVPLFACMHHETLDGKGYPRGNKGEDIPIEARILAIADVFDALTASDRPYRKKVPEEKATAILKSMADDGKLDISLVEILAKYALWEKMNEVGQ